MLVNDIDDIVKQNHYGARCWLNSKDVCQEIGCPGCQVFLDAVRNAVRKVIVVENYRVPEAIKISF